MKIDKKYLPSKKFVAALSIAVFVILLAVALSYIKLGTKSLDDNALLASTASTSPSEMDSDHDGLPDWEEALYGTDPHNPDTDGDGTPDGEEVKEGRDPLKANTAPAGQTPNNKISPAIIAQDQMISSVDQNINATQKMAQDLMSSIIAAQPANGQMDQDTQNTLVQQALQDIPQKQFAGTTTVSDLNLIPIDPTDQNAMEKELFTYATNFYAVTNPLQKLLGQDITLINSALSKGTALDQKSLGNIVNQYETVINGLIQMPLPAIPGSGGEINHLAIINDLEALVAIDNDIMNSASDTVNVYADLQTYNGVLSDLTTALGTIDTVLGIKRQ